MPRLSDDGVRTALDIALDVALARVTGCVSEPLGI